MQAVEGQIVKSVVFWTSLAIVAVTSMVTDTIYRVKVARINAEKVKS